VAAVHISAALRSWTLSPGLYLSAVDACLDSFVPNAARLPQEDHSPWQN
jgi:hypothetical protein